MINDLILFLTYSNNFQMNLPEIQKIMMEFEKQSEIMDMKEEMMDDAIDSALGDDDDEEEGLFDVFNKFKKKLNHFSCLFFQR